MFYFTLVVDPYQRPGVEHLYFYNDQASLGVKFNYRSLFNACLIGHGYFGNDCSQCLGKKYH